MKNRIAHLINDSIMNLVKASVTSNKDKLLEGDFEAIIGYLNFAQLEIKAAINNANKEIDNLGKEN